MCVRGCVGLRGCGGVEMWGCEGVGVFGGVGMLGGWGVGTWASKVFQGVKRELGIKS